MELELVNADKIWEKLTCDYCYRFLSVSPIKVYPNRKIKCGRCSRNDKEGVISLFYILASQFLFKCVNRFDGCRKLLRKDQVEEHEKNCVGEKYFCPLCPPESLELPTYLLLTHFMKEHKGNILQQPWVLVELGDSSKVNRFLLYRVDDNLFFVTFKFDLSNGSIFLSSVYVGTAEKAQKMMQRYCLYSKDFNSLIKSDRKSCDYVGSSCPVGVEVRVTEIKSEDCIVMIELDLQEAELFQIPFSDMSQYAHSSEYGQLRKIFLSPDFLKSHPNYSIDSTGSALVITHDDTKKIVAIQCIVCFEILQSHGFFISESGGKSFCEYCVGYYKVKEPDTRISEFSLPQQLKDNLKIYCKWKCNALIPYQIPLIEHERFCLHQTLKACPVRRCTFNGNLCDLHNHLQSGHDDMNLYLYLDSTGAKNKYDPQEPNKYSFILVHDEFSLMSEEYSFDSLKCLFKFEYRNRKPISDKLQLAVIAVYDDNTYCDTYRQSFILNEDYSMKFKVILEKVPMKIFCGSG